MSFLWCWSSLTLNTIVAFGVSLPKDFTAKLLNIRCVGVKAGADRGKFLTGASTRNSK